jgi:pimeloyl-ACP methyl ester carboxylesterase
MMNTIFVGEQNLDKPLMVMLAGFGGSGVFYYSCFESLSQHFRLVLVDLIGMGLSSRPSDFNRVRTDMDLTLQYMIDYLERWRKTLGYTDFYLFGHSFGGYIGTNYAR